MKHAYLIMAHNEFEILSRLLQMLDFEKNDIYLHIDKKAICHKFIKEIELKFSKLFYIDERIDVRWGDLSQIKLEMLLYERAHSNGPYGYYHLISGVDLPLKNQEYIHFFCERNSGCEFISFSGAPNPVKRVAYYHYPVRLLKSSSLFIRSYAKFTRNILLAIQKLFKQRRDLEKLDFRWGGNWCGLTDDAVGYLLSKKESIFKFSRYTFCSDEVYKQTFLWGSPFREKLYSERGDEFGYCREIDWKRGNPYVWKSEDIEELKRSDNLFARKFSSADMAVVDLVFGFVLGEGGEWE